MVADKTACGLCESQTKQSRTRNGPKTPLHSNFERTFSSDQVLLHETGIKLPFHCQIRNHQDDHLNEKVGYGLDFLTPNDDELLVTVSLPKRFL